MNVAVLTLTRDRLDYTKHCFAALRENAGCAFDHYVLDNGSGDDTVAHLTSEYRPHTLIPQPDNIGIARGLNMLLDHVNLLDYDVVVHFDNDCELTQPNALRDLAQAVVDTNWILSPRILGLNHPPQPTRQVTCAGHELLDIPQIGGICLAAPAWWYDDYRYPEDLPKWGHDDAHICAAYRHEGGACGYVKRLEANHYETSNGQAERYPDYWARKLDEMGLVAA